MAEEELKRRCEALEEQARRDEAERRALRQQLAAHDKLAQRRAQDEEVARLEQRGAAVHNVVALENFDETWAAVEAACGLEPLNPEPGGT